LQDVLFEPLMLPCWMLQADRKAEIEQKKKRLEELRSLREDRARRRQERHGSVRLDCIEPIAFSWPRVDGCRERRRDFRRMQVTPVKDAEVNQLVDQLLADAGAATHSFLPVFEHNNTLIDASGASGISLGTSQPAAASSAQATPMRMSVASRFKSKYVVLSSFQPTIVAIAPYL
jgi:hypothetical protein